MVHLNIAFRKAAKLGDRLRIETGVESATENSVTMGQNILASRTGETILSAKVTHVYYIKSPERFLPVSDKVFGVWTDLQQIINWYNDKQVNTVTRHNIIPGGSVSCHNLPLFIFNFAVAEVEHHAKCKREYNAVRICLQLIGADIPMLPEKGCHEGELNPRGRR